MMKIYARKRKEERDERRTWMKKSKLRYWFDNQMASGTGALVRLLFIVTAIAVFGVGLLVYAIFNREAGYASGVFTALLHIMDPGTMAEDGDGSVFYIVFMLVVCFIGILLTSTLTGIICNAIDDRVQELRRGKSVVVEQNHVVVLGTDNGIYTIISELIEANLNQKREALVIMDDKIPKDEMDERIRQRFPDTKTTRVICRSGSICDLNDLSVCSIDTCRSVIINADDDFLTIKSILAVTKLIKESGNKNCYITAVIRDEHNIQAAEIAGEGYAEILSFRDAMSRIIAHTSRHAGLSAVYTELFDYDGSEFYIEEHPEVIGKPMFELNLYFPVSIVAGLKKKDGRILMNPDPETLVEAGDKLILFAEDDGVSKPSEEAAAVDQNSVLTKRVAEEPLTNDILILGYSRNIPTILGEEDHYVAEGSLVTIAIPEDQAEHLEELNALQFRNIHLEVLVTDIYNRDKLEQLLKNENTLVLVLADADDKMTDEDAEMKDAKILMVLLQLKYLSAKGHRMKVTSEVLRAENQELAEITEVNDFVIGRNISSLILTQISQFRELKDIFHELLTEEGSEIYVRPAKHYIHIERPVNIYTAGYAAAIRKEVLIGYRKYDKETDSYTIVSNPPKDSMVQWGEDDCFIVIAED